MKLFKKYLLFNISFFLIHLLIQVIFNSSINSNYAFLIIEFILFSLIFNYFYLDSEEKIILLFSLSNLAIYLFFIWVIEKSLSIDLLIYIYENEGPLTILEVSQANDLEKMSAFRINQGVNSGLIENISGKVALSSLGERFTILLSFLRNLYF